MSKLIIKGGNPSGYVRYIVTRDGVELLPREGYLRYMAARPGAKKRGMHGLFSDRDSVDLSAAMTEPQRVQGNVSGSRCIACCFNCLKSAAVLSIIGTALMLVSVLGAETTMPLFLV